MIEVFSVEKVCSLLQVSVRATSTDILEFNKNFLINMSQREGNWIRNNFPDYFLLLNVSL